MQKFVVSDIEIELIRKDIKNVHLTVYPPKGRVRISAPSSMTDDSVRLFAVTRLPWIRRKQRELHSQNRVSPPEYKPRESHYFQGRRYLLNVVETDGKPNVQLRNKKVIEINVKPGTSALQIQNILTEWYRQRLKGEIPDIINKWEQVMSVKVDRWHVKQMRTKWGSCNIEKRSILLNLELAKKPLHCLEYIIVHEMVHLLERKHNQRFKLYLDKFLPKWKQYKRELNQLPIAHPEWGE